MRPFIIVALGLAVMTVVTGIIDHTHPLAHPPYTKAKRPNPIPDESIYFASGANTGIYIPAVNQFAYSKDGEETFWIDDAGVFHNPHNLTAEECVRALADCWIGYQKKP